MFEFVIGTAVAGAASVWGYVQSRRFVRTKLRFVDAVQKPAVPVIVGAAAAIVTAPLSILPLISGLTAVVFGVGIGAGVHHGAKDARRLPGL